MACINQPHPLLHLLLPSLISPLYSSFHFIPTITPKPHISSPPINHRLIIFNPNLVCCVFPIESLGLNLEMLYYRSSVEPMKLSPSSSSSSGLCDRSNSYAVVDLVLFLAVIAASGFLLFPYANLVAIKSAEIAWIVIYVMSEEVANAPLVYASMGMSVLCAALAAWALLACAGGARCGSPSCRGLRNSAEFDIQLETEECVKNGSNSTGSGLMLVGRDGGVKKGLFELPRDHHRELEAELRKMAPPNGRAVLVFRARCGCSVGRLEVPANRKVKKIKK